MSILCQICEMMLYLTTPLLLLLLDPTYLFIFAMLSILYVAIQSQFSSSTLFNCFIYAPTKLVTAIS